MIFDFTQSAQLLADLQTTISEGAQTIAWNGGAGLAEVKTRYQRYLAETDRLAAMHASLTEKVALAGNINAAIIGHMHTAGPSRVEYFCAELAGWQILATNGTDLITAVEAIQTANTASFNNFKSANATLLGQLGLA